uniref:Ig-like domain-containing protein n=1 Tax=Cyprinodon variegatus TaxID=28743 RepID=A0A3Q2DC72_CYPVA
AFRLTRTFDRSHLESFSFNYVCYCYVLSYPPLTVSVLFSFVSHNESFHITPIVTQQPNWPQIFRGETVTLRCEINGGGRVQWKYEWIPSNGNSPTSSEYNITAADSRNYRCRGRTGDKYYSGIILVSPAHPVTEGDPVTLSCGDKEQKLLSNVFFYHNNKLIHNDSREELKISAVSKSDEGFYKCKHSRKESPQRDFQSETIVCSTTCLFEIESKAQKCCFSIVRCLCKNTQKLITRLIPN